MNTRPNQPSKMKSNILHSLNSMHRKLPAAVALLGVLASLSVNVDAAQVDTVRRQALVKRGKALESLRSIRTNFTAAKGPHELEIQRVRRDGSDVWAALMGKDPNAPGYTESLEKLREAGGLLDEAESILGWIPTIIESGRRHGLRGDAKMAQALGQPSARVKIHCYWAAMDWYRQAIVIFNRAQNHLNWVGDLITSAATLINDARRMIGGLPPVPGAGAMPGGVPMP